MDYVYFRNLKYGISCSYAVVQPRCSHAAAVYFGDVVWSINLPYLSYHGERCDSGKLKFRFYNKCVRANNEIYVRTLFGL